MVTYNVARTNLAEAEKITPGKLSPTVTPLENPDWVAVSALVKKKESADVMDALIELGAKDILLTPIIGSRMGD